MTIGRGLEVSVCEQSSVDGTTASLTKSGRWQMTRIYLCVTVTKSEPSNGIY